ncbi:MAG: toll/interleukin-1 receptor domain-containing protein [Candidatus Nanopelagicaceae bacterium]|nr:toll/interleukin-1 receptor domain-containing protein [Candidatus Nanopelagicaceae bacterium]
MTNPTPLPSNSSVFISYARADDESPPDDDKAKGWVTFFWAQLRYELTYRGAKQAKLWLDRYQIEPQEAFTEEIEKALSEAKLIVTVLSRNWISSDWCRRELETFNHIHIDASDHFIPIFKENMERASLPALMQGDYAREGYQFYKIDDTGKTDEFYWRGLKERESYFDLIKRIAELIISKIDSARAIPASPSTPTSTKTIFIALPAKDLRDARQRLVNDLKVEGIEVVPMNDVQPETAEELESVIKEALVKAELVVHLLSEKRGITVEGTTESIVDYQLRLARETALPSIYCLSYLSNIDEFIKNRIGNLQDHEEIYGESITKLSQWLRQRLKPAPAPIEPSPSQTAQQLDQQILVTAAHSDDKELAIKLARNFQGHGPTVKLYSSDAEFPPDSEHTTLLIPWGNASESDLLAG